MDSIDVADLPFAEPAWIGRSASETALFRPSEYTAALIQVLHSRADWIRGARALELGSGSGVVLAAMGALDAASLCGIDIEDDAIIAGEALLQQLGHSQKVELHQGDMWAQADGRQFDLIAANLPQFPMEPRGYAGRLSSWSSGGTDGRNLLDRFFAGLPDHLAAGGRAIITHNGFVDLERSRAMAARAGFALRSAATIMVHIGTEKLHLISRDILTAELGRSIHRYGPYAFGEVHVVEIGTAAALG